MLYHDFLKNIESLNLSWQTEGDEYFMIGDAGFSGNLGKPMMAYFTDSDIANCIDGRICSLRNDR